VVIPEHVPGVRTPSKHNVGVQVNPEMPVFVHDPPDGSASVQSPGPSAFGSSSEASQFAARLIMRGVVVVEDMVVNARVVIKPECLKHGRGGRFE
jgi:hypothetical protein